jgi:hypothetical protein
VLCLIGAGFKSKLESLEAAAAAASEDKQSRRLTTRCSCP